MKNKEVARLLYEIAQLLSLTNANPFRIRAYEKASLVIGSLPEAIEDIAAEGKLKEVPGVGESLVEKIEEFLRTGKISYLEELKKRFPEGILEIMSLEGMGPKKAKALYDKLHISKLEELMKAAQEGRIRKVRGFGAKVEENILKGIAQKEKTIGKMYLPEALSLAEEVVKELSVLPYVRNISPAGSVRRFKEMIGDIDILCTTDRGKEKELIKYFTHLRMCKYVLAAGVTKASCLVTGGFHVDVRVVKPAVYGAALLYFTGSKEHNIQLRERALHQGFTVSEYGLFSLRNKIKPLVSRTEEELYHKVGLDYIPPMLREARGEIEAAEKHRLPRLVELQDIKGDIHVHSSYSEGANTISEIAEKARALGYAWVIICDHSQSLKVARGLSIEKLGKKILETKQYNEKHKDITVLCGTEVDILADGSLDYPDSVLEKLDFVLAAVHSRFKQPEAEMTGRIVKALQHPLVDALAHPTGRLLQKREPYALTMEKVFAVARDYKKILEINAYPDRLDLPDTAIRKAKEMGIMLAIGTDAHDLFHMDYMKLGVGQAQRGWVEKGQLLNCKSRQQLIRILR